MNPDSPVVIAPMQAHRSPHSRVHTPQAQHFHPIKLALLRDLWAVIVRISGILYSHKLIYHKSCRATFPAPTLFVESLDSLHSIDRTSIQPLQGVGTSSQQLLRTLVKTDLLDVFCE